MLLVDDDTAVRNMIAALLRARGFHVLEARNGLEAVQVYGSYHGDIALVISDVDMPVMGGPEAVSRMQAIDKAVRVLFITGRAAQYAGQLGRFRCLPKPFTPAQLIDSVSSVLADAA